MRRPRDLSARWTLLVAAFAARCASPPHATREGSIVAPRYVERAHVDAASPAQPPRPVARTPAQTRDHDAVVARHQSASRLRQEAVAMRIRVRAALPREREPLVRQASETLARSEGEYDAVARAYEAFLAAWPDDVDAYELRCSQADALFWARRYDDAARAFDALCEADPAGSFAVAAAYMTVMAREAHLRQEARAHRIDPCLAVRAALPAESLTDEGGDPLLDAASASRCAGSPEGDARVEIPSLVSALVDARAAYIRRVPASLDTDEGLREVRAVDLAHAENNPPFALKYAHLNARALLRFGHLPEAERALRSVLQHRCDDAFVASEAVRDISALFERQNRRADLDAVLREQISHPCVCVAAPTEPAP